MRYLFLLHGDATAEAALSDAERRAIVDAHGAFSGRLREAGAMVTGEGLEPPESARTVRWNSDGAPSVTDGPFAEAKEAVGGFYVIEAAGIDEAVRWARQVPRSPGLAVEILPVAMY